MKNLFAVLIVGLFVSSCSTMSSLMPHSSNGLRDYSIHTLPNGLNVLMVKDQSLPYLTLSAFVMNGYAADPKSHTGLTNATLNMLDKGYHGLSADKISAEIEQLGAELDVDVSADYSVVNLDGLSWQEGKLLEIFSNLILKPDFSDKELARFKSRTVAEVKQRLDQLNYLASEIYDGEFYKNHPYGHRDLGSIQDIEKMSRNDIVDQYKNIMRPDQTWIVLVGQWSDDFAAKLDQTFATWKIPTQQKLAHTPIGTSLSGRDILLVDKADAAQAEIRIGRDMVSRQDPDYLSIMVANTILGQGFSSRLMDSIRVKQCLT
jgi:zinc protease